MPKKPEIFWPFAAAEAILGLPSVTVMEVAAFQLIKDGEIGPAMEFWMWLSILGLAGPIILAAIYSEASKKD